jgi:tRNA(Ile)-lysidine synthase
LEFDIVAAHLHHGQREEADAEQRLCEAFADTLGVPFATGRADIPTMSRELKIGYEEAGRNARYTFFRQAAFRLGCNLIATAHTRNDLVETVLLNMTRGCGIAGLRGIPDQRDNIVRPLLPFGRDETRLYCEEHGLWYHDDPANSDLSFSRARIRHRVLPELRSINPKSDESIAHLSELAEEEDRFLNGMAAAALEQSEIALDGDLRFLTIDCEIAFHRGTLTSLPAVLFRRAIRLAGEALGSTFDRSQTLAIADAPSGAITAEGGLVTCQWTPTQIAFRKTTPTSPFRYPLTIPGETLSDEFGWSFTAYHAPAKAPPTRSALSTALDAGAIKGPIYFRTAESGDSMQPIGFDGTRKISDLLSESKLTASARKRLPIVCDLRGPLWIPGVCVDGRAAARSDEMALHLQFGPVRT